MKLELKHLAPYLPYGLKVKNCFNQIVQIKGIQYGNDSCNNELYTFIKNSNYLTAYIYQCKPILRPLSDLTKEMEHNGEKFVPFHRLNCYTKFTKSDLGTIKDFWHCRNYIVVEKLFEWHFDVFGLIDSNLAIDLNTL